MLLKTRCLFALVLLVCLLVMPSAGVAPYMCSELLNIISNCSCEAAFINNVPDITKVVINCRHLGLIKVPTITGSSSHEIWEMSLAENNIQTILAEAFKGLRIQNLILLENRLTNISANAFKGLESDLRELHIGAEVGADVRPPLTSLTNLTNLRTLTLENFRFENENLVKGTLNLIESLEVLSLRKNKLTYMEPQSVPLRLRSLELDGQALVSLPIDLLRSHMQLETVIIKNTQITAITDSAFEFNIHLRTLDLGYNKINLLNAYCFKGITTTLQYLSLRNNPIRDAAVLDQVKELRALQTLQLSEIYLGTLPASPAFLLNKVSLSELHLELNQLTTINADVFSQVGGSLTTLSLNSNQISSMSNQSMAGLTALRNLDLSQQKIGQKLTLPASLSQMSNLTNLALTNTSLVEDALWYTVSRLTALQVLKVGYTGLTEIRDNTFRNLSQLSELILDGNNISVLTQAKLAGARDLTKLHLGSNKIQNISNCVLYQFRHVPKLYLDGNPLNCDCRLRWLLVYRDSGNLTLSTNEVCAQPDNKRGQYLHSLRPADLMCPSSWSPDTCDELYTTLAPVTIPTTPTPIITITVTNITKDTIKIKWVILNNTNVQHYKVRITELESSNFVSLSAVIPKAQPYFTAQSLHSGKSYSLCVISYSATSAQLYTQCLQKTTLPDQSPINTDDNSKEVGIIVGTVVAGVVLIAIIAVIIYLLFIRKKSKKSDLPPQQPHVFAPSELPSMGAEAKRFTRPKDKPKVGRALDPENIKVTVISDGKTGPRSPAERISAGSYQYLDQKHPQPHPEVRPSISSYSNDVKSRALPSHPVRNQNGEPAQGYYYKMDGNAQPAKHHTYNQVNH